MSQKQIEQAELNGRPLRKAKSLEAELSRLYAQVEDDDGVCLASGATNLVLTSRVQEENLESLLAVVAEATPGRFFAVCVDSEVEELSISASTRCHRVAKNRSVCSEVVRIDSPPSQAPAIPSIIKAHSLTGQPLNLFVQDASLMDEVGSRFAEFADVVYLDSQDFFDDGDGALTYLMERLLGATEIVDRQWLRLEQWREFIEQEVDRVAGPNCELNFQSLEVGFSTCTDVAAAPISPYLLCAWLGDCLGVRSWCRSSSSFEGETLNGRLQASVVESKANRLGERSGVFRVSMEGEVTIRKSEPLPLRICIEMLDDASANGAALARMSISRGENQVFHDQVVIREPLSEIMAREASLNGGGYSRLMSQANELIELERSFS